MLCTTRRNREDKAGGETPWQNPDIQRNVNVLCTEIQHVQNQHAGYYHTLVDEASPMLQ